MKLHGRGLPSSFCHLQSVISSCSAGGPRPLQPQPLSLLSRAINHWDSVLNGETADNGPPVVCSPTSHNQLLKRALPHSPTKHFSLSKPSCGYCLCQLLCLGFKGSSPTPFYNTPFNPFFCDHPPSTNSNQANWPWGLCKCPSCLMECHFTDASSSPSSHPKSKSPLPGWSQ